MTTSRNEAESSTRLLSSLFPFFVCLSEDEGATNPIESDKTVTRIAKALELSDGSQPIDKAWWNLLTLRQRHDDLRPTKEWLSLRRNRVTASRFGRVLHGFGATNPLMGIASEEQATKHAMKLPRAGGGGKYAGGGGMSKQKARRLRKKENAKRRKLDDSEITESVTVPVAKLEEHVSTVGEDVELPQCTSEDIAVNLASVQDIQSEDNNACQTVPPRATQGPMPLVFPHKSVTVKTQMLLKKQQEDETGEEARKKFGLVNEERARQEYIKLCEMGSGGSFKTSQRGKNVKLDVIEVGSVTCSGFEWMVASPDGLVRECISEDGDSTVEIGLLEIKTNSNGAASLRKILENIEETDAYWQVFGAMSLLRNLVNKDKMLAQNSSAIPDDCEDPCSRKNICHYYSDWCDLVYWSPTECDVKRIYWDEEKWTQYMYPLLANFYVFQFLPEFLKTKKEFGDVVKRLGNM